MRSEEGRARRAAHDQERASENTDYGDNLDVLRRGVTLQSERNLALEIPGDIRGRHRHMVLRCLPRREPCEGRKHHAALQCIPCERADCAARYFVPRPEFTRRRSARSGLTPGHDRHCAPPLEKHRRLAQRQLY